MPVYAANLFFSLHYAAILYVNSSLLEGFFNLSIVSLLYVAGALGNVALFFAAPKLISRFGNRAIFIVFLIFEGIATAGLALSHTALPVAFFFLIYEAVAIMTYYCLDIFLEAASTNSVTGNVRGIDLTLANTAIVFGPLMVAIYASDGNYFLLYAAATLLLIPLFYLAFFSFKTYRDSSTLPVSHVLPFRAWNETRNIRGITLARFSLEFFYALMAIYVPIYLHLVLKFNWEQIGIMFTIMLLPFVFLQLPAGYFADKKYGEKEMLALGFFATGVSLLFMPFIGPTFVWWTVALFASRIGAALIEVMTDTYFFKQVNQRDTGMISIYRLMRPVAVVIAAVIGGLTIMLSSYIGIFFVLMLATLWGMWQGLKIIDTK